MMLVRWVIVLCTIAHKICCVFEICVFIHGLPSILLFSLIFLQLQFIFKPPSLSLFENIRLGTCWSACLWWCNEGELLLVWAVHSFTRYFILKRIIHDIITCVWYANFLNNKPQLQIKVDDDGNIQESKFKTFGCGSAIASSSVVTEWVKGKHVDEVLSIKNTDIAAHLKLPPVKLHCSMLAEDAIRAAVGDWKSKKAAKKEAA